MAILGPKMSIFLLIISSWGVIQLGLMAMFLLYRSVAFAEDIEVEASTDFPKFYAEANREYSNYAFNCGIASLLYFITLILSGHQVYLNRFALNI